MAQGRALVAYQRLVVQVHPFPPIPLGFLYGMRIVLKMNVAYLIVHFNLIGIQFTKKQTIRELPCLKI